MPPLPDRAHPMPADPPSRPGADAPASAPPAALRPPASVSAPASAEQALAMYRQSVELLPCGLSVFGADDRLMVANRRFLDIWRLPAELGRAGTSFQTLIAASPGARVLEDRIEPLAGRDGGHHRRRLWDDGAGRVIEVLVTRLPGGACVALHHDVTERHRAQQQVAFLARHDALTGLANRAELRQRIGQALAEAGGAREVAVLCLDLDRFKAVNDTLGHAAGDQLLLQVAQRLAATVRQGDVVARLGGDEFALLQPDALQPAAAAALAQRLIDALGQPYLLDGQVAHVGASVGVAMAPYDGDTPDELLHHADMALYRAKAAGRGQLRFYEPAMGAEQSRRRGLEADLRRAIERGEFELAFQPQVALPEAQVVGLEALIRWNHPQRGRVSPADFIPLAEDSGLIVPIGRWVLHDACRRAAAWPQPLRVAVNVSALQFRSPTLAQDVLAALAASGLAPQRLELEITEAVLLEDTEHATALLAGLRERGVRTALDDFGTGYSSLSYLRRFPFDAIKIDRSFIVDAAERDDARAIVQAIGQMGRSLGMRTVAEGVETVAQLSVVHAAGCSDVQGYLFSRPRSDDEVVAAMRAGWPGLAGAAGG